MGKFGTAVALAAVLGVAAPAAAEGPSCARRLVNLAKVRVPAWVSVLVIGAVVAPPAVDQTIKHSLHHEVVALVTGDHHLGAGIYFDDGDWRAVLASLTDEERELVRARDPAVVELFTNKLYGDYDESRIPGTEITQDDAAQGIVARRYSDYPLGIRGRHFVLARGEPRGNCDHKARVLAELLRRAGFDAAVERAMVRDFPGAEPLGHAYVVVGDRIADPTRGEVWSAERYRARFVAYKIDYFGRPSPGEGK